MKTHYSELQDDAGSVAHVYVLAVGALLRVWAPADAKDAAEAVYQAVVLIGPDVKHQSGAAGLAGLVTAAEQALEGFDLDESELDLIRNDIRRF